jgi:hypothetical protein
MQLIGVSKTASGYKESLFPSNFFFAPSLLPRHFFLSSDNDTTP